MFDFLILQRLLLDAQNCSGESALWRAMFNGKTSTVHLLLDEGAASFTMARVKESVHRRVSHKFCCCINSTNKFDFYVAYTNFGK